MVYRILVVEDDADNREGFRRILSREGYEVDVATDGIDAMEKATRREYDLVLTDHIMPRLDGLGLLNQLRGINLHLPVLVMTAFGDWWSYARAIDLGAAAYLTKPFRIEELLNEVRKALRDQVKLRIGGQPQT